MTAFENLRQTENSGAGPSNAAQMMMPHIFKLNVDCIDKIFDYLSAKDLHLIGQTCRMMQTIAGKYFQLNYCAAEKFLRSDGVQTVYSTHEGVCNDRTETTGFNKFTQFLSHYYEGHQELRYLKSHIGEFEAVNHLYLVCLQVDSVKIKYMHKLLPQLEIVQLRQCSIRGDLYDILLRYCKNMHRLYVHDDVEGIINLRKNQWLRRNYPALVHVELSPRYAFKISDLRTFFELNSQIVSFTTNSHLLWANRTTCMETNLKLNRLEIKHFGPDYHLYYEDEERLSSSICELLNQLHANGFYKRLHLHVNTIEQRNTIDLATIRGLDKLTISNIEKSYDLVDLSNLEELNIYNCPSVSKMNQFANSVINIGRLHLCKATYEHLFVFVSRSPKLTTIKISAIDDVRVKTENIFNLMRLNQAREKLTDALKVVIYADDSIFLATKWATQNGNMNLNFVEMRRASSLRWDYDFSTIRILH